MLTNAYVDVGMFSPKILPLDDRALLDSPQVAVLCYSPWAPPANWSLFTHLTTVDTPIAWYYPLTYELGTWRYEYGDALICQLWECDGGPGGCDPAKPKALPSSEAGDDLLGQASVNLGAFQLLGTAFLNMTVPSGGRGEVGTDSGALLLSCPGCRALLRDNPSWVNPYPAPSAPAPALSVPAPSPSPPAPLSSPSPPPSPSPSPSPPPASPPISSFQGPPASPPPPLASRPPPPLASPPPPPSPPPPSPPPSPVPVPPVEVPPVDITPPPPTLSPPPPPPPPVQPPVDDGIRGGEGDVTPEPSTSTGKGSTKSTLMIVLGVLGGLLALLLLGVGVWVVARRRGWRQVQPAAPAAPSKPGAGRKASANRNLRIRVQRPADADAALRQHRVEGAIAELPWAPKTKGPRS